MGTAMNQFVVRVQVHVVYGETSLSISCSLQEIIMVVKVIQLKSCSEMDIPVT